MLSKKHKYLYHVILILGGLFVKLILILFLLIFLQLILIDTFYSQIVNTQVSFCIYAMT